MRVGLEPDTPFVRMLDFHSSNLINLRFFLLFSRSKVWGNIKPKSVGYLDLDVVHVKEYLQIRIFPNLLPLTMLPIPRPWLPLHLQRQLLPSFPRPVRQLPNCLVTLHRRHSGEHLLAHPPAPTSFDHSL